VFVQRVRDRQSLIDALSVTPEFLRNKASESGQVIDYRDWGIPLGRRFRALKVWFVLRTYGIKGLQQHIRRVSLSLSESLSLSVSFSFSLSLSLFVSFKLF
jgi:aromatic-L-amino-acid decarboxylase